MKITLIVAFLVSCSINTKAQDFVVVGKDSIEYTKTGEGEPWIVLVSGMGGSIHSYDTIVESLSEHSTVIRYSRAGLSRSTYNIDNKSFTSIIDEMNGFLKAINVPDSIILVGHSYAGLMIRAYAKEHPEQVKGLVSLDPTFEDYFPVLEEFYPNARELEANGVDSTIPKVFVDEFNSALGVWNSPNEWDSLFSYDKEIPHFCISSMKAFPSRELRSTVEIMKARYDVHERIVNTSNVHLHLSLPQAGHVIQWEAPNITIDTILLMLDMIRNQE
jgi:pimeloyl-ACP methyl ester carboxylesterase